MKALVIQSTSNTPKVLFEPDTLRFEISGESRPENVSVFYLPILEWMKDLDLNLREKENHSRTPF